MKIRFWDGDRGIEIDCTDDERNAVQELMFGVTSGDFFPSRPVPSRFGTLLGRDRDAFGTVGTLPSYPIGTPSVPPVPIDAYTVPVSVPPSLPPSRSRPKSVRWFWIAILVGFSVGLCVWSIRRTPIGQSSPTVVVPSPKFTPKFGPMKNVQP